MRAGTFEPRVLRRHIRVGQRNVRFEIITADDRRGSVFRHKLVENELVAFELAAFHFDPRARQNDDNQRDECANRCTKHNQTEHLAKFSRTQSRLQRNQNRAANRSTDYATDRAFPHLRAAGVTLRHADEQAKERPP